MTGIKAVHIENFQSHAKSGIDLPPGGNLCIITGPSDAGKTAIIRALRWLWFNLPQGADFIRVGCSFARVRVDLSTGWRVIRERTRSRNRYVTVSPEGDRQEYEGFGNDVPVEIQQLLAIRPVIVGDLALHLNLAGQLEGPFLGSSISAGARARVLGHLAGTEEVDTAARKLGTDIWRRGQDVKRLSVQLEELTKQADSYSWVPELGERIGKVESLLDRVQRARERLGRLKEAGRRYQAVNATAKRFRAELQRYRELPEAVAALGRAADAHTRLKRASDYLRKWRAQLAQRLELETIVAQLAGAERAGEPIRRARHAWERRLRLVSLENHITMLARQISTAGKRCECLSGATDALPHIAAAREAALRLERLKACHRKLGRLSRSKHIARAQRRLAGRMLAEAGKLYRQALVEAGRCPTCGARPDQYRCEEVVGCGCET